MAEWKQRREIGHGCEGRGWREQSKCRYIDMMGINHIKFSRREIENVIGPSLFLRNKGSERVCMFLGASLLSSGSFTMKTPHPPTPHNGGEGGRLPDESQSLQAFWSTAESRKSRKFFLVESGIHLTIGIRNPDSTDKESEIQVYTDKKSGIQYLECGTCRLESRIQDFLGLPYMGWSGTPFTKTAPRISICWPRNLRYSLLKPFPDYGLTNQSLLASTNKSVYLYCDL